MCLQVAHCDGRLPVQWACPQPCLRQCPGAHPDMYARHCHHPMTASPPPPIPPLPPPPLAVSTRLLSYTLGAYVSSVVHRYTCYNGILYILPYADCYCVPCSSAEYRMAVERFRSGHKYIVRFQRSRKNGREREMVVPQIHSHTLTLTHTLTHTHTQCW